MVVVDDVPSSLASDWLDCCVGGGDFCILRSGVFGWNGRGSRKRFS